MERAPFDLPGVSEAYEDWYATPFGRLADELERELLFELVDRPTRAGSILEVGCGTGHFSAALRTAGPGGPARPVFGIDLSPAMLRGALDRVPVARADAARLPFATDSVDAAVLIAVLDFVADPERVLREALRVARQRVALLALVSHSALAARRRLAAWRGNPIFGAARFYSRRRILELARRAGAEVTGERQILVLPPSLAGRFPSVERALSRRDLPLGGLLGLRLEPRGGPAFAARADRGAPAHRYHARPISPSPGETPMAPTDSSSEDSTRSEAHRHFIQVAIDQDLAAQEGAGRVVTRFPPEPNGYLHIGHAKAICLNSGLAREYGGQFNLRFDDTNPSAEESEFVEAIQDDVRWLGAEWGEHLYFASDYFERLWEFAVELVQKGKAYVCDLSPEETREYRGTVTSPGKNSPYRDRSPEENLDLFERMRAGEFADGSRTLRAKIDMASPNMNMRDPVMYRINRAPHHRTGTEWCIYPMYDWAHGQSDAIEGITHSLCTLEFENHRPLYDWFLDNITAPSRPRQIEFARLNLTYTITSKRKLTGLVKDGHVSGWDDPRMPTLRGLRRRGYTPEAIWSFCERIGIAKFNSTVDMVQLENAARDDLNKRAPRAMGVLDPVRLVIENYPEDGEEMLEAVNSPEDPSLGTRQIPFSRELFIERSDFREEAPRKYFRLTPGREVRLRYAYYVTCTGFEKDPQTGEVTEVRCTYDPETRGGDSADGRKVKGTIHWVSARHAARAEIRLYDHLFATPDPTDVAEGQDFAANLNPDSLVVLEDRPVEPSLTEPGAWEQFQLERQGYFCVDDVDSTPEKPVFNRTVALRDSWAKLEKKS